MEKEKKSERIDQDQSANYYLRKKEEVGRKG